jgi:para-nitrobenzyl esterase
VKHPRNASLLVALCTACGSASTQSSDAGPKADASDSGKPVPEAGHDASTNGCALASTKTGPVEGNPSGGTCAYEGIPFAAPPTGNLRWKAPVAPAAWTTPRPSAPASGCPQVASPFGVASTDEDCLYLNVWSPEPRPGGKAPVMVFVHGGAFVYGSGTFSLYDGTKLAGATGNLVVTLNYRLGPFGFLSSPALRSEDKAHGSSGDYGILDQLAAIQWVHDNIASFGGDPSNVTIFGESAGGTSMVIHLASPVSRGLFSRVIIESAAATGYQGAIPTSFSDTFGANLASVLGCTDAATSLACLRGKPTSDVLNALPAGITAVGASMAAYWFPVVDGYVIPKDPIAAIVSGSFAKVPTLLGNNKDEGTLFTYMSPPTDDASYLALEELDYPGHGAAIVAEYPIASYAGSYFEAASAALTNGVFLCPTRRVARAIAASGTPTYRYDFTHVINFLIPNLGAFHSSELLFVFGNPLPSLATLQASELPLSKTMMGYWGSMAKTGDPNGGGRFAWPKYEMSTEPEIVLDLPQSTVTEYEKAQCDFWDGLGL